MNIFYVIIGLLLIVLGWIQSLKEWRKFKNVMKKSKYKGFTFARGVFDAMFFGGLGVIWLIMIFVGLVSIFAAIK